MGEFRRHRDQLRECARPVHAQRALRGTDIAMAMPANVTQPAWDIRLDDHSAAWRVLRLARIYNAANGFVAHHQRIFDGADAPEDRQVAAADANSLDADEHFASAESGLHDLAEGRSTRTLQHHRLQFRR